MRTIEIKDIVVVRSVPFNEEGCDQLRAVRSALEAELSELYGEKIRLPFPTVISLMLNEYVNTRGIHVSRKTGVSTEIVGST